MSLIDFRSFINATASKKGIIVDRATTAMLHPTGFLYFDYAAGNYVVVYDDDEVPQYLYHNIGIAGGSYNTVISKSQGGKTTLTIKFASSIIEPYVNSLLKHQFISKVLNPKLDKKIVPVIQILETEGTLDYPYVKKLTQYPNKMLGKYVDLSHIDTDKQLISMVEKHCAYKQQHMDKIFMPMNDLFGAPIYEYPPTIMIIDSMTDLTLEDAAQIDVASYETQTGNTFGMRRAKIISAIVQKLNMLARQYNITIFGISHINVAAQITAMPQPKQYRGLRQGETINGGERAIYLSTNILRLDVFKEIGIEKSSMVNFGEDVTGFISRASLIKCKTNSKRNVAQLVYTDKYGYDPLLSTLWQAKEMGHLPKAGNYFYLPNLPQFKFTMKTAKDTFGDHPTMISELYRCAKLWCEPFLDNADSAVEKDRKDTADYLAKSLKEDVQLGLASESDANELASIYNDIYAA